MQKELEQAKKELSEAEAAADQAQKEAEQAQKEAEDVRDAKVASGTKQQASNRQESSQQNPTVQIGEPVRIGDARWLVTNARQANVLRSEFGDTKRGNFVIIDFQFTNMSNESVTLDTISLPLMDGRGRTYESDTDSYLFVDPAKDIFLNQVNPGVMQQGEVIYSVAPGASGFELHAGDLAFFSSQEAIIELGF